MPIRPENRARYPPDWNAISARIRHERAGDRCECTGHCGRPSGHLADDGRCRNRNGQPAWSTGSRVILTVAHLDHTPEHCGDDNLLAACQGCHLHYDREHHRQTAAATKQAALAEHMYPLF